MEERGGGGGGEERRRRRWRREAEVEVEERGGDHDLFTLSLQVKYSLQQRDAVGSGVREKGEVHNIC